jgi:hypothetical protein
MKMHIQRISKGEERSHERLKVMGYTHEEVWRRYMHKGGVVRIAWACALCHRGKAYGFMRRKMIYGCIGDYECELRG